ncbi:11231_t:CDS:1, partial [Gigaspora rosea]
MSDKENLPNIITDLSEKYSKKIDTSLNEDIVQDLKNPDVNILHSPKSLSNKEN